MGPVKTITPYTANLAKTLTASAFCIFMSTILTGCPTRNFDDPAPSHDNNEITDPYPATVSLDRPRAYWRLNETSGQSALDYSGAALDGTYQGSVTLDTPGMLTPDPESAVTFDGVSAQVSLPIPAFSIPHASPITVEAWLYVSASDLSDAQTASVPDFILFSLGNSPGPDQARAVLSNDGSLSWNYGNSTHMAAQLEVDYSPYLNQWTHLVLVSSGSSTAPKAIYINGILVASDTPSDSPGIDLTGGTLGSGLRGDGTTSYLKGSLSEFAIYSAVLPVDRILAHYHASGR